MFATDDLIFAGASLDKKFRAVDLNTGEMVWRADLPAPANATSDDVRLQG